MRTWKYTAKLMEKDALYPDFNVVGHSFGRVEAASEREAEYKAHDAAQIQLKCESYTCHKGKGCACNAAEICR